jgi:hypothetical protein
MMARWGNRPSASGLASICVSGSYEVAMKRIVLTAIIVMALSFPASAAGIDSRAYTCSALQALIAANRFIFISAPVFGDFVVSDAYYCSGGESADLRSVPTSDNPGCVVKYCTSRSVGGGG